MNNLIFNIDNSRILFHPFNRQSDCDPISQKSGIRVHDWLTAFISKFLAKFNLTSGILTAKINGQVIYFNRGSFEKWCIRHQSKLSTSNTIDKINEVVKNYIQLKSDEEEEKEKFLDKVQTLALSHLNKMTSICYNSDGQLNTKLYGDKIIKKWNYNDVFFDNDFFVHHEGENANQKIQSVFKEYNIKPQTTFYHGTSLETAAKIKEEGFNPLAQTRTGTDSGAGTYLTTEREKALGYAKDQEAGLLSCQINSGIKIVHLTSEVRDYLDKFRSLVGIYTQRYADEILNDFQDKKYVPLEFETKLWDLFVRDFFLRLGFRGIYTDYSGLAGSSYLNLFESQKDVIDIK